MDRPLNSIQDFLVDFTYYLGRRSSNSDKKRVYEYLLKKFEGEWGYKVSFDAVQAGIRVGYCIIGEIEQAETLFICPLDTSRRTFMPGYRYYPLNDEKRKRTDFKAAVFDAVLAILLGVIINLLGKCLKISSTVMIIITAVFLLFYNWLHNTRFTFSRSASDALVSFIAANNRDNKKYAYAFVDKCADSYVGLRLFLIKNKERLIKVRKIIYFDCLAHSEKLVCACNEVNANKTPCNDSVFTDHVIYQRNAVNVPVCFKENDNLIIIVAADKVGDDYCVDNIRSGKDKTMNVDRLKKLAEIYIWGGN